MQDRPGPQQELFRLVETRRIRRSLLKQRRIGQPGDRPHRREIAQAARRVLDVGLELIERGIERRVPLVGQRQQRVDQMRVERGPAKRRGEAIEEIAIARDRTGVEQREEKLRIVRLDMREVLQLADLVPDHESEIPQRLEKFSEPPLVRRVQRAREQHEEVDVRVEAEVTPAVAAQREDDRRGRVAERAGEQFGDEAVDGVGVLRQRRAAALSARRGVGQFLPGSVEPRAAAAAGLSRRSARRPGLERNSPYDVCQSISRQLRRVQRLYEQARNNFMSLRKNTTLNANAQSPSRALRFAMKRELFATCQITGQEGFRRHSGYICRLSAPCR